ncbi:ABC transporter substrate-binding protein [Rhodococcus qingshengii]|uniref:ABC transporter substrate-binding protein n=1 Tax=Rhodococcus qingshengii TaxID=334542 RepID=UPI0037CA0F1F
MYRRSRYFVALVAAVALCGACSTSQENSSTAPANSSTAQETQSRVVTHVLGEVRLPTEPQNLIALDEIAGLTALSLGVTPKVVYASTGDAPAQAILTNAGSAVIDVEVGTLPPVEELATKDPDVLIGTGAQSATGISYDQLSKIAPTLVIDVEGTWREHIESSAKFFGKEEIGARQISAISAELAAAKTAQPDPQVLSLLGNSFSTTTFTMPPHLPISNLIADAGFVRPAFQQQEAEGYSVVLSPELLAEQNAPLIAIPNGKFYTADAVLALPTAGSLTGTIVKPVGELWFGTYGFAYFATASDLRTLAGGGTDVATTDDVQVLWDSFTKQTVNE